MHVSEHIIDKSWNLTEHHAAAIGMSAICAWTQKTESARMSSVESVLQWTENSLSRNIAVVKTELVVDGF